MNILFVTSYDATNFRLDNIIGSFINKGDSVYIYHIKKDKYNIRMFQKYNKHICVIKDLTDEFMDKIDFIFCGNDAVWRVKEYNKYIFTYNAVMFGTAISEGGDFMFIPGNTQTYGIREETPVMKIGNPMFDNIHITDIKYNNLLFIDSGHYPFGTEGKFLVAKLIIDICNKFPNYTLTIKPRFLMDEKDVTHKNTNHLYKNIEKLCGGEYPKNLIMLNEHKEMSELIEKCDTVLCMYTTAYLEGAMYNKGIIVIDNLPTEDSIDLKRELHWERIRNSLKDTGCLVDYHDVLNYLPLGIKCQQKHIDNELKYVNEVADKITEVCRIIYEKYIRNNKYLKVREYSFELFEEEICESGYCSWKEVMQRRIYNEMVYTVTRKRDMINYKMEIDELNRSLFNIIINNKINPTMIHDLYTYIDFKLKELILRADLKYINDDIQQSFLWEARFYAGCHYYFDIPKERILKTRAYYYFKGRNYIMKGEYEKAIQCLKKHYDETIGIEYEKYVTDTHKYISSSIFHIGWCYMQLKKYAEARSAFQECNEYENGTHIRSQEYISEIDRILGCI